MLNSFKNRLRLAWRLPQLYLASRFGMPKRQTGTARLVRSVLIVPSDPFGIIGAKGDEAMLVSLIENLTANIHGVKVSLLCDRDALPESISTLGVGIERGWISPWSFGALKKTIAPYDALVIIGADILDGYYSLLSAARYWVAADLAARQGKTVVITGFSFNASPPQLLKAYLTPLPDSVNISGTLQSLHRNSGARQAGRGYCLQPAATHANPARGRHSRLVRTTTRRRPNGCRLQYPSDAVQAPDGSGA
jgi:hypothetical protein